MKNLVSKVKKFVAPLYKQKDAMHDLSHIERVLTKSEQLAKDYDYDPTVLICGAYMHGLINKHSKVLTSFLKGQDIDEDLQKAIIKCAKESDKSVRPQSIEGKIIHDAHLLEGGIYFSLVKSLITGITRKQSLQETLNYYKNNIYNQFKCCFPENQKALNKQYQLAIKMINDIEKNI
ncbi:MAG: hypothetical protein GY793_07175 [Proteobacteria bacterium]|nr:hypothetical protein [Pseudomonadota bacterium]